MITDLNAVAATRYSADVCIAGTGAAGMALASRFFDSQTSVIFIESGGHDFEAQTQELYRGDIAGLCHDGTFIGRTRQFGGSTNCWGGQLLPLEPLDFQHRPWVGHSGWPFERSALDRYYQEAARFFGADSRDYQDDLYSAFDVDNPFHASSFRYYFSKWIARPNLRLRFRDHFERSSNIHLLLHANLTKIDLAAGSQEVARVECRNDRFKPISIEAKTFVLCLGGIETPRVLLSNNHQRKDGLGNEHGFVGKYFQDHPEMRIGTLIPTDIAQFHNLFRSRQLEGSSYTARFSLTPERQREHALLNASGYFHFHDHSLLRRRMALNLAHRVQAGASVDGDVLLAVAKLTAGNIGVLARRLVGRPAAEPCVAYAMTEQEPCDRSVVSLGTHRDRFGVPRARIDWNLTDKTRNTFQTFARLASMEFERTGLGRLVLLPHLRCGAAGWSIFPHEAFHHMGTTRMSASADGGVVDANCKVFGLDNLYVSSSSVFPTSGHSNPTLTIAALAFRLFDHLSSNHGRTEIFRAGTPAQISCAPTDRFTTDPAATIAPRPMRTPLRTTTPAPSHTSSSSVIGASNPSTCAPIGTTRDEKA